MTTLPKALDVAAVLAAPATAEPFDFVLPGLARRTVGALIGPGGLGKSYWILSVLASIASGQPLCGLPLTAGRVVYFSAEDYREVLGHRLRAVSPSGIQYQNNLEIYPVVGVEMDVMQRTVTEKLEALAKGARLLVLDTLSRFHTLDENSTQDMKRVMARLESIALNTGAAVLYIHHTSKGAALAGQGGLQQAARGSSVLVDNARWASYLLGMTDREAKGAGIPPAQRDLYVRWNISKQNYGPPIADQWYRRTELGALMPIRLPTPKAPARRIAALSPAIQAAPPVAARTSKYVGW